MEEAHLTGSKSSKEIMATKYMDKLHFISLNLSLRFTMVYLQNIISIKNTGQTPIADLKSVGTFEKLSVLLFSFGKCK